MRLGRDMRGVEGLPVVLLLGVIFGACTFGIGAKCLMRAQNATGEQRAIESFNTFVERARAACMGGVGSAQQVRLELSGSRVLVDGRLVQLAVGDGVLRTEILPLPVVDGAGGELGEGSYLLELKRATREGAGGFILGLIENGALHVNDYYLELRRL